jgi:hypothetical protein
MKPIIKLLSLIIMLAICGSVNAQYNKNYLNPGTTYTKGKIYIKKSLQPIEARNIKLVQDTVLQYADVQSGDTRSVPVSLSNVNYIKVKTGTRAGSFALYGGGLMCLSALVAVLSTEADWEAYSGESTGIKWAPFVGAFTAGGAVVGGLVGAFIPKYTNYYLKTPTAAYNVRIVPQYYGRSAGIGMVVTF